MAEYDVQEAVIVNRGFQFQNNWHFNHKIKCITQQTSDAVFVFYNVGSGNIASLCPYKQHTPRAKHFLPSNVSNLIYIRKFRLLIASCPDLALRIYSEHFELIDTVHITTTILSLAFNEATSELYTGGIGHINTWLLKHQLHNPLVPNTPFVCSVKKKQWVISLDFDPRSEILVATCQDAVYVINTRTHTQTNCFTSTHHGYLTSAVFFHLLSYVVTAAKDGSLKVWNCILHSEVHTLTGHLKAVTGLQVHPTAPCVISCSLDGSIRMWHLENMTQCYCLDYGEQLLGMCTDFPFGNRLTCYSHYSLMMWQVNQVETHFASVNSHVMSMSRVEDTSQCVKKGCTKARILALAEDGGVRLLSPVTGQVITILFPMSSSQLLRDVVYSLKDSLLFVLLKTSEVIVFDAATNPCSARQLWVAPSNRQLLSIALCCVLLENGSTCCLVFGGEKGGHIALLFSSGAKLSMPHPCPAHDGHVTKLFASCDTIVPFCRSDDQSQWNNKIVQTALVSYGTDDMLNIWCLKLKQKDRITLKLQMSIHMKLEPVHGRLFGSHLCLSFPDNHIVMINTPKIQERQDHARTCIVATSHSFSKLSHLIHQAEDDHAGAIIALQCCPKLSLFATSSKDGHVKIWNEENQLVSEIDFGESLTSVCFANSRGDLLVGFQKHVSLIQARDYLPKSIINANYRGTVPEDCIEQPMTFDSDLEFWYDSGRTPCYPAEQNGRRRWNRKSGNSVDNQPTSEIQSSLATEVSAAEMRESAKSLQSKVDSCMAQKLSQQYVEELHSRPQSKLKKRRKIPYIIEAAGERNEHTITLPTISSLPVTVSPRRSNCCLHESVSSGHLACAAKGKSSKKRRSSSRRLQLLPRRQMSVMRAVLPKAEVEPLQVPASANFPIAPDGFIPNSVLRNKFNYTPPVVILEPYQPPNVRQKMIQQEKKRTANLSRSRSNDSYISSTQSAVSGEQFMDYSESSNVIATCISRQLSSQDGKNRRPTASSQKSSYYGRQTTASTQKSSHGGYLHPNTAAEFGSNFDWNESEYSMTFSPSSDFLSKNHSRMFEHTASSKGHDVQILTCKTSKISGMDDTSKFSKTEKQAAGAHTAKLTFGIESSKVKGKSNFTADERKVENSQQRRESSRYSDAEASLDEGQPLAGDTTNAHPTGHKSCDHTHANTQAEVRHASLPINPNQSGLDMNLNFSQEETASVKSFPKRSSSVIFKGSQGAAAVHRKSVNYSIVKLDSLHVVALKKIQNSSWYPKDRQTQLQSDPEGLTEVVNTLISLQQNSTMPVFNEICKALLELNRGGALEEEQKKAIANELSRRLSFSSESADNIPLRTAALGTLEKIGVGTKQVILHILPLLTDPNVEVLYAAFSALRAITGVANRTQLHRLFVKLGLLQHVTTDEERIMSGLANRVDSGSIQLSPNSRILDVCKVGANFGLRTAESNSSYYNYGSDTNFRDSFATKSRTYNSGQLASSRSRKKRRHTLSEGTDQSRTPYGQLEPLNSPSHVQRRTYPGCENNHSLSGNTRLFRRSGCGINSLSMQGEGLFTRGCLPNATAAFKVSKSKIQELILQRPTDYSQSRPAARMLLGAYGCKDVGKLTAEEYEWSEIFRVARRASRSVLFEGSGKSGSRFDPEFTSVACFSVCEAQPASRRLLKLPDIDTERTSVCVTHHQMSGSRHNEQQLRIIDNDMKSVSTSGSMSLLHGLPSRDDTDSENTGLVVKLPEIASDVVRVAQKS